MKKTALEEEILEDVNRLKKEVGIRGTPSIERWVLRRTIATYR